MKKILIISGIVILLAVFGIFSLKMNTDDLAEVQVEKIRARKLVEKVTASGRIQPRTKVDITSEINGEIIDLRVKEGDVVSAGDLLVVLDTVQLRTDVDQARYAVEEINARLRGNKTLLEQNTEEYERQKRLFENNLTSETAYNNSHYAYLTSKSNYEASRAQSQQFKSRYDKQLDFLSKAKIVAPMSGVLTYVNCEVGEIAAAQTGFTQGRILMIVADLSVFEVEVEVDETEIAKIRKNQEAEVEVDALIDTVLMGKVVEIGNTAIVSGQGTQDQSTNFKVKIVLANPHKDIRPGMSATVDIVTNTKDNVLTVPFSAVVIRTFDVDSLENARLGIETPESSAVDDSEVHAAEIDETDDEEKEIERDEFKGVFIMKNGEAHFVEVKTGIADQKNIEIISTLEKGDTVISGPYRQLRNLKEGDKVKVEIKKKDKKD